MSIVYIFWLYLWMMMWNKKKINNTDICFSHYTERQARKPIVHLKISGSNLIGNENCSNCVFGQRLLNCDLAIDGLRSGTSSVRVHTGRY